MPDFLKEKSNQINFIKRRKAAELLQQIELHQSAVYNLSPVKSVVEFLDNAFASDQTNEELWEMSLALEPREREGALSTCASLQPVDSAYRREDSTLAVREWFLGESSPLLPISGFRSCFGWQ
jgi:hypothetical protein